MKKMRLMPRQRGCPSHSNQALSNQIRVSVPDQTSIFKYQIGIGSNFHIGTVLFFSSSFFQLGFYRPNMQVGTLMVAYYFFFNLMISFMCSSKTLCILYSPYKAYLVNMKCNFCRCRRHFELASCLWGRLRLLLRINFQALIVGPGKETRQILMAHWPSPERNDV